MREWMKDARKKKNLTQEQVAERIGCSRSLITDVENEKASPSISTAKAIAETLDFKWTIFFDDNKKVG